MIDSVLMVLVAAFISCGLTEYVKKFLPEVLLSGWKITLISGLIAVGCGLVIVFIFGKAFPFPALTILAGTVAASTLLYNVIVKTAKSLVSFLKSKIN